MDKITIQYRFLPDIPKIFNKQNEWRTWDHYEKESSALQAIDNLQKKTYYGLKHFEYRINHENKEI